MIGLIVQYIFKYLIAVPLYSLIVHIIPILVIFGIPIFMAGMIVAAVGGVLGHIFFLLLFVIAIIFYFKFAYNLFYPGEKKSKEKKN
jgi:hypothetical protein